MSYSDTYDVNGWFYKQGRDTFRKQLDIKLKGAKKKQPDLMVIMMNPGSSEQKPDFDNDFDALVPTVHDPTQTHIMNLMEHWGMEYARILNLSDYCDQLSENFYEYLKDGAKTFQRHTIFHTSRAAELNKLFILNVPVLVAWGTDDCLKSLGASALTFLADHQNIVGLRHPKKQFGYYHPRRRVSRFHHDTWRDEMKRRYNSL